MMEALNDAVAHAHEIHIRVQNGDLPKTEQLLDKFLTPRFEWRGKFVMGANKECGVWSLIRVSEQILPHLKALDQR